MEELLRMRRGREFQVAGAAIQQSYENRTMYGHVGPPTNDNLMNEVDETERNVACVGGVNWAS